MAEATMASTRDVVASQVTAVNTAFVLPIRPHGSSVQPRVSRRSRGQWEAYGRVQIRLASVAPQAHAQAGRGLPLMTCPHRAGEVALPGHNSLLNRTVAPRRGKHELNLTAVEGRAGIEFAKNLFGELAYRRLQPCGVHGVFWCSFSAFSSSPVVSGGSLGSISPRSTSQRRSLPASKPCP